MSENLEETGADRESHQIVGRSVKERGSSKDVLARSKLPIRRVSHSKEQTYHVFLLCSVTGRDQPIESVASWRGEGGFRVQHLGLPVDHAALSKRSRSAFSWPPQYYKEVKYGNNSG